MASDSVLGIFQEAVAGIAVLLVGIVGLSLLVGGIVIMNIMLMVVSERTREIGLRKALGAKRRDIMSQVLTESITLSLVGGIVGIALGALFSTIISSLTPVPSAVEMWSVALGVVITAAVGPVLRLDAGAPGGHARPHRSVAAGVDMATFTKQMALLGETAAMAMDTLRSNKMRSALTVLGVVIGVTSIVGMTSLIRGFDTSLRNSINTLGPNTIFIQKFGAISVSSGASFMELMRRPNLTVADQLAIERLGTTVGMTDIWLGAGPGQPPIVRFFYRGERTRGNPVMGTTEQYVEINFAKMHARPLLHRAGSAARRDRSP